MQLEWRNEKVTFEIWDPTQENATQDTWCNDDDDDDDDDDSLVPWCIRDENRRVREEKLRKKMKVIKSDQRHPTTKNKKCPYQA